ncbi:Transmembrane protein [Melia azedarach]|uniref:Transmembrane protein n=1 Tax=Melia azedarach TaxID=155640 RepID=A0ACC1XX58_MELAZ|nr:Transmembrane protein [Melia azedarach]
MSANKQSPSCPSMSSSRPNPIVRNSESKDPMRRSFSGNPFAKPSSIVANSRGGFNPNTPLNSPTDFPRRSSFGRENSCSLSDYEDKENSKSSTLRPGRVQSPASASKGTKNFMSPTISAASKFTTSPRKKILVERNEPFRSSVSFSDAKGQSMENTNAKPAICSNKKKTVSFSDAIGLLIEDDLSKPEMSLNEKKIEASYHSTVTDTSHNEALKNDADFDSEVPLNSKNDDADFDSEVPLNSKNDIGSSQDCVNLDSTFKISPRTSCSTASPMLAPLDADPLMPPYDPKTNYLSPRPQFLHYKPNPRIELMNDKDGTRLEESFMSENLSDSEVSETLSDSQKESEDVSSGETVKEESEQEEESEKEKINVPEPNPVSTHKVKEIVQSKVVSKSKFFTRSKFIALLLALVFAFMAISVSDSTVTNLSVLKDLSLYDFYVPPEIVEYAKVNFEVVTQKSRLWAANSFSYICELLSEVRGVHKLGHLQYSNLSALIDGYPKFAGAEFNYDKNLLVPIGEIDAKTEPLEENHQEIEENEEDVEEALEEDNNGGFEEQMLQDFEHLQDIEEDNDNIHETLEDHTEPESEEVCSTPTAEQTKPESEVIKPVNSEAEQTEETVQSVDNSGIKLESNIDVIDQPVVISEVTEIQPEPKEPQGESDYYSHAEIESTKAEENAENTELDASLDNLQTSAEVDKFLTKNVVGISSLVILSLLAATVFFFNHAKKGKLSNPKATNPVVQSLMTKKLDYSPISVTAEHASEQRLTSRNWQTEDDDDMLEESASSEMSSFKVSSSHSKKGLKTSSEAHSQERKPRKNSRRESLASSDFSLSSASYGSFTTYEKFPSKHGYGDEEVVTPVRRSSRIRNLVTFP